MRKVPILLLILLLSVCALAHAEEQKEEDYVYPITPESENWFAYTPKQKAEMLKIDEKILQQMSDRQLVRAIATYPFLVDILVYGSFADSIRHVEGYCSALGELIKRDEFERKLTVYFEELKDEYKDESCVIPRKESIVSLMEILVAFYNHELPDEEYEFGVPDVQMSGSVPYASYTIPMELHTDGQHDNWDHTEALDVYNVTRIRLGTCRYNCHSYAWHSQSAYNIYWIADPTAYTTSGNYTLKYSGSVSTNIMYTAISYYDIVFYQAASTANMHSALFIDNPSSGVPLAQAMLQSKWGRLGVLQHRLTEVPPDYDYAYISVWH